MSVHFETTEGGIQIILINKEHRDSWSETRVMWDRSGHRWFGWCKSFWRTNPDWDETVNDIGPLDLSLPDLLAVQKVFGLASSEITPEQVLQVPPDELMKLREEHLRVQAYHRWEFHGRPCGDGLSDWLAAEKELGGLTVAELAILQV